MSADNGSLEVKRGKHWSVGTDVQMLSLMHRRQARIYRAEQQAIERRLKRLRIDDPERELSEADAAKLANIDVFLKRATSSVIDLNDARDTIRQSTDTDTLVAQLRHEFALAAGSFTADELTILGRHLSAEAFAVLERVRAVRFPPHAAQPEASQP